MRDAALDRKLSLRWRAVRSHAILDGNTAAFILAERRVNDAMFRRHVAMNDGEILFFDRAALPNPAQFQRGVIPLGHNRDAAGFTIKAINRMRARGLTEIQPHAADEARQRIAFGRVTNQARRFVNHQQVGVFVDDGEQITHGSLKR